MYYRYFGLQEEPFSIAVNPRYLFMSARHRDALAHLLYGVGTGGGFILLTGEVGTGKTTINRCLMQQLPADTDMSIILNPALNAEELLATACDELGIEYDRENSTLKDLTDRLHAFLLENHRKGRNTVLLIDEAQHLQFDVLEQIRLLTNLETNTRKLLQIILVGQPELSAMLAKPELRQLNQRITARYNLQPLNLEETDAYIRHRLQVAGLPANQELFPRAVVKAVYRKSRGIPRLINMLCDRTLLGSYGQNKSKVDLKMLQQAAREVLGEEPATGGGSNWPKWLAGGAVAAALLAGVFIWQSQVSGGAGLKAGELAQAPPEQAPTASSQVAAPEAAVAPQASADPWSRDSQQALQSLAGFLGITQLAPGPTCDALAAQAWRCETQRVTSWDELMEFDRPAVLQLLLPARFAAHAVLVGISGESGVLLHEGREILFPLAQLGPLWQGEFVFLWQPPADYSGPIKIGDRGPVVAWLAARFAAIDGQAQPLAGEEFNAALDTRVRLFQRQFNLRDDGVVGLKTLLKLDAVEGGAASLQVGASALASLGER